MGRRVALLIATYSYQDAGLRRLTAPAHDVESLAGVLGDPAIAGFEVTTLVNEPHHRVGASIGDFYRDSRRDDLTLLYFTGHGLKDDEGRLHLAMTDTRRDSLLFTGLSAENVDRAMESSVSQQKVLILDCCYSGAYPSGVVPKGDTAVHTLERFQGRGRTVLTASDSTQYAFEGDDPRGTAARSVFTHHLVEGLRDGSADLDGDGDITLDELYSYVYEHVVAEMPQQRPKKLDNVQGRTVIARNVNWALPAHLRHAIDSPVAVDRLGALDGLDRLYRIGNDVVRAAVRGEYETLADDDSRQVSAAAATRLPPARPTPVEESSYVAPPVPDPPVRAVEPVSPAEPDDLPPIDPSPVEPTGRVPRRWSRPVVVIALVTVLLVVAATVVAIGNTYDRYLSPLMAVGPGGTVHVVWNDRHRLNFGNDSVVGSVEPTLAATAGTPIPIGWYVDDLALSPSGETLYAVSTRGLVVANTRERRVVANPAVNDDGSGPGHGYVAPSPDGGRLYVSNPRADAVTVLDTATLAAEGSPIPVSPKPGDLVVSPDGTRLWVSTSENIQTFDTATGATVGPPILVPDAGVMTMSSDGSRIGVLTSAADALWIVDTATGDAFQAPELIDHAFSLAMSPDGTRAYVPQAFGHGIDVIDTATGRLVESIALPASVDVPVGVALSAGGSRLLVAAAEVDSVSYGFNSVGPTGAIGFVVIDTTTLDVVGQPIPLVTTG